MKLKHFFFFLSILLLAACSAPEKNQAEINSLKQSLKFQFSENANVVRKLEIVTQGNAYAKIYWQIALKLNERIEKFVDTTFSKAGSDTAKFSSEITVLNKEYQAVIDSFRKTVTHKIFLAEDDSLIRAAKFELVAPFAKDEQLNYYLTAQQILHNHRQVLRVMEGAFGVAGMWFLQIENTGYMVTVVNEEKISRIKLFYRYPNKLTKFKLLGFEKITDDAGRELKIISKNTTANDTIIITTDALENKNYNALVKYSVYKVTGDIEDKVVRFPFSGK